MIGSFIEKNFDSLMTKLGRKKIILDDNGDQYMVRYYLYRKPNGEYKKYNNLFLHKIVKSDTDEHCHNHPWPWATFLIHGSYKEYFRDGSYKQWNRFSFRKRGADFYHKLILEKPVWSLFWHGKREQDWGFWYEGNNIFWVDYKIMMQGKIGL